MSDELTSALVSLFVVALVAALAPFIVALVPRLRVPQVVVLIVGGIIIGPQVMHLAEPKSIELLRPPNVGLGFIFLLAGYELELALFRQRPGKLAIVAWVASAVIAGVVVGLLAVMGLVRAFVPVALGLTTTALGTLLPILRDNNMLRGSFGSYLLAGGAVGEFSPSLRSQSFSGQTAGFSV
jgi:Kef-type K+ transport system membrane component KefB